MNLGMNGYCSRTNNEWCRSSDRAHVSVTIINVQSGRHLKTNKITSPLINPLIFFTNPLPPHLTMPLQKIASLPALSDRAWASAPHPTLPLVATCSANKTVQISSLRAFTAQSTIEGGHKRTIRDIAWKPHTGPNEHPESVLATASFDATAGVWRRYEGETTNAHHEGQEEEEEEEEEEWRFAVVLDGHENEVKSVAWSAGGSFLATCSRDKSVWIWEEMDDDNFETIAVLQDHTQDVKCVRWHPEEEVMFHLPSISEVTLITYYATFLL